LFLFIASTLIASLYLFSSDIGANGLTPQGWMRPLILGIPAVLIVYFLLIAENNNLVFSKIFVTLGNASYSIYLSHILTLSVMGRVWSIFNSNSIIDNWIMIPVMFVLTCVAGVVSYFWIEIPLSNKIFKKNY
jgi:exopolysaccharide production protein ExoZ